MGPIVILSGPVGAGKTTVARELVSQASDPTAYIEGDVFWSFIARPAAADEGRARPFKMIMRAMLAAARHYEREGYEVIVDFTIPPWYLEGVTALLRGEPFDYVVIRPSEAVCAARAAARTEGAVTDYARFRELYVSFDAAKRFTISDDSLGEAALAARIRAGIAGGEFRIGRTQNAPPPPM